MSVATPSRSLRSADLRGATRRPWLGGTGRILIIAIIAVYCLAPFYWMVVSSLREPSDIFETTLLPTTWTLVTTVFGMAIGVTGLTLAIIRFGLAPQ